MYLYETVRLLRAISTIYIAHASLSCSCCFKIFLGRIFFGMCFRYQFWGIIMENFEALSQYWQIIALVILVSNFGKFLSVTILGGNF